MKKIIYVGDDGYMVLGTVSASTDLSNDELKQQYGLADTIPVSYTHLTLPTKA